MYDQHYFADLPEVESVCYAYCCADDMVNTMVIDWL